MINKRRLLNLTMMGLAAVGLCACGGTGGGGDTTKPELTVWCTLLDNDIQATIIKNFQEKYPDYANYNIHVIGNIAENETQGSLHKDTNAAADVICMVDDNIQKAVASKELLALGADEKTAITATDGEEAVNAASIGGTLYGYPYRADNAPLLIYNDKKLTADDVSTFEKLFAKAKSLNSKVACDIGNGWYNPFILWMGGGDFTLNSDMQIAANFANVKGCATSAQAMYDFYGKYQSAWNITSDNAIIENGLADGSLVAAFFWNDLAAIRAALPSESTVKVASWPTFDVGGTPVKCTHFKGYKDYVIKAAIDETKIPVAKAFCAYATSEEVQNLRCTDTKLQYGPSNIKSKATEAAKALEWNSVIMADDTAKLTRAQALTTNSDFWDPMGAFGGLIGSQSNWGEFGSASRAIQNIVSSNGWNSVTSI